MANDPTLPLRQEIVKALKASGPVTALVAAERIFGERAPAQPVFPFIRYGQANVIPILASCWDGAEVDVPIHSFSKAETTDQAAAMNKQVANALDKRVLDLGEGLKAHLKWTGGTIIQDGDEASAWHGIQRFTITIAG